jgi:hypothetical protein
MGSGRKASKAAWRSQGLWATREDRHRLTVMTVVEGILLAISVAAFVYLAIAIFAPERF